MRMRLFLLIGALALLFGPSTGLTQFGQPGGGGGRGGGGQQGGVGGGGMGQWDPNQLFNMMSGGKDVIVGSDIADPGMKRMFDRTVQRMGISDGQITREQFAAGMQQAMAQRANRPQGGGTAPGGPTPPMVITLGGGNNPQVLQGGNPWGANQWGGNPWGGNQWGGNPWGGWGNPQDAMPDDNGEEEVKKPVVYKANNLPRELDWFGQLDKDRDGQIGLYEWRAAGLSTEEFVKRDLNGDGFITVEEILKYEAKHNPKPKTDQQGMLAQSNGSQQGNFGPGNFGQGGGQRGNFGPGNFGPGGGGQRGNFGPGGGGQPGDAGQGNRGRRGNFGPGSPDQGTGDGQPGGYQRTRTPDGQGDAGNGGNRGGRGGRGGGGGGGRGGRNQPQGDTGNNE